MSRVGTEVMAELWRRMEAASNETIRVLVTCGVPGKRGAAVRKQALIAELQSVVREMYKLGVETGYDMACHVHGVEGKGDNND